MKLINYFLLGLLGISFSIILYFYFNPKIEKVFIELKPKPQIVYVERSDGGQIATVEKVPTENMAEVISKEYMQYVNDTLVPALNKGIKYKLEVQQLTKINAVLKDSLSRKNVVIDKTKNDVIAWKTKYIEIESNSKDSTVKYAYNAQLDIIEYNKKSSIFGNRKQYIAISSPDKNLKINDVENYSKLIKTPKDFLELNIKLQGLYLNKQIIPYGGAEILINPDGKFKPIIGYGYFYDHNSSKLIPYYLGGIQYNVFRL